LECFERAQFDGVATILEQTIAPRRLELELLAESEERYPQWRDPEGRGLSQYFAEREEQEWTLADTIVCGSDFVKRGLMRQGIPGRQIHVVPYGIDPPADWSPKTTLGNRLRVLFVGSINARKGVPALMEASEKLPCCEFRLVGGGRLPEGISIPSNVRIVGPVPRTEVSHHYRWADVFLLPSLCEGSATVIYEALSQGVPVICTPNAGSVVRDGMEGKIIPALDPAAIREALESFLAAPNTLEPCSQRARSRALEHTLESYGDRLLTALAPMEVALGR
jgi:glycosyltransferase involved in cell wall biosynthesis